MWRALHCHFCVDDDFCTLSSGTFSDAFLEKIQNDVFPIQMTRMVTKNKVLRHTHVKRNFFE